MSEGHICKIHQKECIQRSEENYFFRLSKYWDDIRRHIESNPDFILPTSRRSQVLVWLEEDNKRDFSISRASTSWGIPVPDDDSQAAFSKITGFECVSTPGPGKRIGLCVPRSTRIPSESQKLALPCCHPACVRQGQALRCSHLET